MSIHHLVFFQLRRRMHPVLRKCMNVIPIANDLCNGINNKFNSTHFGGHCRKFTHEICSQIRVPTVKPSIIDRPEEGKKKRVRMEENESFRIRTNENTHLEIIGMEMEKNWETKSLANEVDQQQQRENSNSSSEESFQNGDRMTEEIKKKLTQFRWTEYSPYARDLMKSNKWESVQGELVSVVSYNVLSQILLEKHRQLYREHDQKWLRWNLRSRLLKEELADLNADILCLQEVDFGILNSFYDSNLNRLGYEGIYKKRTNDRVDGCAIYFKKEKFNLVNQSTVEFYRKSVNLLDRDNIGIILRLSLKSNPEAELIVATTHLLYNQKRSDIKLAQTQLILAEIERMAYLGHDPISRQPEYLPIVFAGDMNYCPDNGVYQLVTKSFFDYRGMPTIRGKRLDETLLPPAVGITDSCQYASSLFGRNGNGEMNFSTGILRHHLNLESVYDHVKFDLPEGTTNQIQWVTVDYIFYSQSRDDDSRTKANLKLISRLTLPNSAEAEFYLDRIPNSVCPSDHLPLSATFLLAKKS